MEQFNFELILELIADQNYLLITNIIDAQDWGTYDNAPIVSVIDGISYVKIRLVENGEGVSNIVIPLTKPEEAQFIEVTVLGVDEDGNELGEPQPKKEKQDW